MTSFICIIAIDSFCLYYCNWQLSSAPSLSVCILQAPLFCWYYWSIFVMNCCIFYFCTMLIRIFNSFAFVNFCMHLLCMIAKDILFMLYFTGFIVIREFLSSGKELLVLVLSVGRSVGRSVCPSVKKNFTPWKWPFWANLRKWKLLRNMIGL